MKIGIDMDDTICSTNEKIVEYEVKYLKETNLTSEELWNIKENRDTFLHKFIGDIWESVDLKDGVAETLRKLKKWVMNCI